MALDQVMALPGGDRALITGDVLDVGRRINEGDPTVGWEGDPTMVLAVDNEQFITDIDGNMTFPQVSNPQYGWFEVWGLDAHNKAYLAACRPYCDSRLLAALAEGHWKRGDLAERIIRKNQMRVVEQERQAREQRVEANDKLHFALLHDIGAYEGGLTKRIH